MDLIRFFVTFILIFSLGCASSAKVEPQFEMPETLGDDGSAGAELPEKWWEVFGDAELNRLMERAIGENFSLKAYAERFEQAKAVAKLNGADIYPTISAGIGFDENLTNANGRPANYNSEKYSVSLSISYEIDLWGRIRALRDSANYSLQASAEDFEAAAISLSATVAETWFQLTAKRAALKILEDQYSVNEKYAELTQLSYSGGSAEADDILQQKQQLLSIESEISAAKTEIAVLENLLSVLVGKPPRSEQFPESAVLPEMPEFPKAGLPSELIERRPDVRSAYYAVKKADSSLAAAMADRYPKLSLSASGGLGSQDITTLFKTWFVNLAANLTAPLFNGGRNQATVEKNEAEVREALNSYSQKVLTALQETEDAIAKEKGEHERLENLQSQYEIAKKLTELRNSEFTAGKTTYFFVLEALKNEQAIEKSVLSARCSLLLNRIALYKAIAGGFKTVEEKRE